MSKPFVYDPLAPMEAQRGRAWWVTLGCEENATEEQVSAAYRARLNHAAAAGASYGAFEILDIAFSLGMSRPKPPKKGTAE